MQQIYFDYNASSPVAQEVVDAMAPYARDAFGNPSSVHWAGRPAREAIDRSRQEVAALVGADRDEIFFTGGGTESDNWAIKGFFYANRSREGQVRATSDSSPENSGVHMITSAIEHPAVSLPLEFLTRHHGVEVTTLPVDPAGRVRSEDVARALRPETTLVSIMHANNEVGTIQPIAEIGKLCRTAGVCFHTDAAQSVGKVPIDVRELQVDLLTIAGHKLRAPKGVGALYIRKGVQLEPLLHGAGHERGQRSGTENTSFVVGLGEAAELARHHLANGAAGQIGALRDRFEAGLKALFGEQIVINAVDAPRLPNTASINFVGRTGQEVLATVPGLAASTGAACHSGIVELSRVLRAMGVSENVGMGAIRFSLGWETTEQEVDSVLEAFRAARSTQC